MAAWACSLESISTKPKPFERPVSRSMMTWADWTVPCGTNRVCRSLSVVPYDRLPTYNLLATRGLLQKESRKTNQAHKEPVLLHEIASIVDLGREEGRWRGQRRNH